MKSLSARPDAVRLRSQKKGAGIVSRLLNTQVNCLASMSGIYLGSDRW